MYMRTTKSGGHEYASLAHFERDPKSGQSRARVKPNVFCTFAPPLVA